VLHGVAANQFGYQCVELPAGNGGAGSIRRTGRDEEGWCGSSFPETCSATLSHLINVLPNGSEMYSSMILVLVLILWVRECLAYDAWAGSSLPPAAMAIV
jgi:hypothetical protein